MGEPGHVGRRLQVDDIYRLRIPESPALSPAVDRVVYVLRTVDADADRDLTCLWWVGVDGEEPAQLTWGPADTAPAWSPDGSRLAFLRTTGQVPQVWTMPVDGGEPRQLSSLPDGTGRPMWSPDGSSIAVVAPVATGAGKATDPVVVTRLGYRADGAGLSGNRRSHVHVLDARTGAARALTRGDWDAGDPAWAPDGSRLAFPAAPDPDADLSLTSQTYVAEVDRPGRIRMVGEANGRSGPVCWTPDGQELLVAGRRTADAGHTSLLRVPLDGGRTLDVTEAFDRNIMPGALAYPGGLPAVVGDGHAVVVCVRDRGSTHVWRLDLDDGTQTGLIDDPGSVVSGLSVAGGLAAVVLADSSTFGEIAVIEVAAVAAPRKLTAHTREALPDVELYPPEQREFRAPDGGVVHAWMIRDPAAPRPAPLVLDLHGGPHNAWHPAPDPAHLYHQALAARGFTVVLPNPRGSDGYGEAFHNAALGAWGGLDEQDVLAPVDRLVAEGQADPERLGVCGYSYGGFLTCHLTGRTDRFAAAVTGGVVADLISLAGTSAERQELATLEWRAFPHAHTDALRAQSPIERVDQVSTPTLILHGLTDEACPAGQAEEWFTALRQRGVPAQMVLYPGGSHSFVWSGRPTHRADYSNRIVDWMERHLSRSSQPAVQAVPDPPRTIADEHWRQRLAGLTRAHGVPGAVLGITRVDGIADQTVLVSSGVLNAATGVPVTPESVFELGSITKPFTATVIMQLVDEGLLDLDAPVREVLPELRLADPDLTARVTMRHLLTHTSGVDGDIFDDTGRGDDCLQRYVAQLPSAAINHPLGATFSYCNTGYVIAGRVIEALTGRTWDQAVRERIFLPLGMARACTLPEEALLFDVAAGHVDSPGGEPKTSRPWMLPRSVGPAGLISAGAADLMAFARLHLRGGVADSGSRLLSAETVALMQAKHAEVPDPHTLGNSWGLGWIRYNWDGTDLVGHDGGTLGQAAFLRLFPGRGLAVCLLTNGGQAHDLHRHILGEVTAELAGLRLPDAFAPPSTPPAVDLAGYVGCYERTGSRTEILRRDGTLRLRETTTGPLADLVEEATRELELFPVEEGLFAMREPGASGWKAATFYALPDRSPYLHYGGRANPKVS